jgi:flagellin-specific chaperone FliS
MKTIKNIKSDIKHMQSILEDLEEMLNLGKFNEVSSDLSVVSDAAADCMISMEEQMSTLKFKYQTEG